MITLNDLLHTIATDSSNQKLLNASGKPSVVFFHHFHLAVTDDVADTEANMQAQYGPGLIYVFSLENYQHGYDLAVAFYKDVMGVAPDMSRHKPQSFPAGNQLYLAVHVLPLVGA